MADDPNSPDQASSGRRRKALRIAVGALAVLLVAALTTVLLAQFYDPVRVIYKRFKAPDRYVFEEVNPAYSATDPAGLIDIGTRADASEMRRKLVRAIWGDADPFATMPAKIEENYRLPGTAEIDGLARMDRLTIPVGGIYTAYAYRLFPKAGNGRTVLYHHGYAGTFVQAAPLLSALLTQGYDVVALNNLAYGENRFRNIDVPGIGPTDLAVWKFMDFADHPMRFYFEPAIASVNFVVANGGRRSVDAIGFSNGGWAVSVIAAVDTRIRRSYPIAGGYPIYLRANDLQNQSQREHFYYPMLKAANYLEMYVLATVGDAPRREMQIFNRFDRCCWRNLKGKVYEAAVKNVAARVGGGGFDVVIDETHADHKISNFAIDRILADLTREPAAAAQK